MKLLILLITPLFLFAKVHYAKIEPLATLTIKSAVSAQVTLAKLSLEGKNISSSTIIKLDDKLDKIKIESSQNALNLLMQMVENNENTLASLSESLQRQEEYYNRISGMVSASQTQKNNAFYSYTNTQTQYFSTMEKIDSIKKQMLDLEFEIKRLRDSISKKTIYVKNKFINKIFVNRGDFVNMGTPLVELKDLSSAKLVLFLEADELEGIKKQTIYIDDKPSKYKISKIWKVTDEKYISSYRTEIIVRNPKKNFKGKNFSELLKVEFK